MHDNEGLRAIICLCFDHRASPDGLRRFKTCLTECPQIETYVEVSGAYDLILQIHVSSLAEYNERLDELREPIQKYVSRYETNFVCKLAHHVSEAATSDEMHIWVKCEEGFRRIDLQSIDRVTAERDYVRIHTGSTSCLHHSTIRETLKMLPENFVQFHRSSIIRRQFIERFIHEKKAWRARLKDGSLVKVSKSHVKEVLDIIRSHSSTDLERSSMQEQCVEIPLSSRRKFAALTLVE